MYLSEINAWNFRRFGVKGDGKPGIHLKFNQGLNLLVGENDSGKTAIVDAIKYTILTQSYESLRIELEDFHIPVGESDEDKRAQELRIECIFRGFSDLEAKNFLEWLGMEKNSDEIYEYYLKVFLIAKRKGNHIYYDIKAGSDQEGKALNGEARSLLRTTYLKPLRDAEKEMASKRNSRLSQILESHEAFKGKEDHYLYEIIQEANDKVKSYFKGRDTSGEELTDQEGKKILEQINVYLESFAGENKILSSDFNISPLRLKNILERLNLELIESKSGLGSHNLLFIATELLLLKRDNYQGLKLALVEEIEAHLHVQAQMRLIDFLQEEVENSNLQLIMTTHSTDLASKVNLSNLIICKDGAAFSMGYEYTELSKGDYLFLERFLDSTKANLFFAQGVILVEGDAENLLIPTIADIIEKPLSKYGVSIVNVGNTAFLRYSRIFKRKNPEIGSLKIPVAAITDNDVRPDLYKIKDPQAKTWEDLDTERPIEQRRGERKSRIEGQDVKLYISPVWTLEYDIALGVLQKELFEAVLRAEKVQNSDSIGLTLAKIEAVNKIVEEKYKSWDEGNVSNEERAFYIYSDLMLDKSISKAITAQCFAEVLRQKPKENREDLKEKILKDENLQYIVQAINYATNGVG
ncbi:AAA family ATPase [Bacillus sp. FSL R10-2789]|uniref:ATP-dependent nuclease n=1 Tax=Bacillus sp. FSL R10-2789 TaxID=2954662 RepID=UPI0030FC9FA8